MPYGEKSYTDVSDVAIPCNYTLLSACLLLVGCTCFNAHTYYTHPIQLHHFSRSIVYHVHTVIYGLHKVNSTAQEFRASEPINHYLPCYVHLQHGKSTG